MLGECLSLMLLTINCCLHNRFPHRVLKAAVLVMTHEFTHSSCLYFVKETFIAGKQWTWNEFLQLSHCFRSSKAVQIFSGELLNKPTRTSKSLWTEKMYFCQLWLVECHKSLWLRLIAFLLSYSALLDMRLMSLSHLITICEAIWMKLRGYLVLFNQCFCVSVLTLIYKHRCPVCCTSCCHVGEIWKSLSASNIGLSSFITLKMHFFPRAQTFLWSNRFIMGVKGVPLEKKCAFHPK